MAILGPEGVHAVTRVAPLPIPSGIYGSLDARKELAKELYCPPELMNDSAKMNMWLHKTVLQKIADNGGNIPNELLG